MCPPARPVVPACKLLEEAGAAFHFQQRYELLVSGKKSRLVRAHVKVKAGPGAEPLSQGQELLLFQEQGAGLATDLGKQVWP